MSRGFPLRFVCAVGIALVSCGGCGYHADGDRQWSRRSDGSLPTVAVEPFENQTYRRGLEMGLTRQIADELRGRSPRAATTRDRAQILLTGRILTAVEQVLSEDRDDNVRESSFVITVEVVLKDPATEKVIRTYSLTESAPFSPRAGRVATLERAQQEALRDLAERIVYRLETPGAKQESSID